MPPSADSVCTTRHLRLSVTITLDLMCQRREAKNNGNIDTYNRLNVEVKRAIRDDCRSMISQRVQNSHPSLLYRQLQPIIAPKRGAPVQPVNLTPDDLNSYFTSIGTETRDKVTAEFNRSGREPLNVRLPRVNTGALNIVPVTLDHLQRILASLPNKSSCLEGDIPLKVLKLTFDVIGRYLLRIVNKSIATETVPSAWKKAVVIPIYKRNDPSSASNFRPITLVPVVCKIMEKIVCEQLTQYLQHQCLFRHRSARIYGQPLHLYCFIVCY